MAAKLRYHNATIIGAMSCNEPDFIIGTEEKYLLVDFEICDLIRAPDALMADCQRKLDDQVSSDFLQCQIKAGTRVCETTTCATTTCATTTLAQ